ncbi:MAG: hypothetical protein IPL19_20470 [Sandaracinaceae bacterium]|nr:hypothetical protein [Sandaracinaceae bacterium]
MTETNFVEWDEHPDLKQAAVLLAERGLGLRAVEDTSVRTPHPKNYIVSLDTETVTKLHQLFE